MQNEVSLATLSKDKTIVVPLGRHGVFHIKELDAIHAVRQPKKESALNLLH
jgi:hypothetical protein